ncbi:hypothetical protein T4E_4088 [Trichinella pseudospiralis]|nr:hypothetical protein T4E_4088 [Trichinella pseudospiralis]
MLLFKIAKQELINKHHLFNVIKGKKTTTGQLQLLKHECIQNAQCDQSQQMNEDVNADEPNTA